MSNKLINLFPPEDHGKVKKFIEMDLPGVDKFTYQGYEIIAGIDPETIKYAFNEWKIKKTDVFVASYPKTGEGSNTKHKVYVNATKNIDNNFSFIWS